MNCTWHKYIIFTIFFVCIPHSPRASPFIRHLGFTKKGFNSGNASLIMKTIEIGITLAIIVPPHMLRDLHVTIFRILFTILHLKSALTYAAALRRILLDVPLPGAVERRALGLHAVHLQGRRVAPASHAAAEPERGHVRMPPRQIHYKASKWQP